jgi:hypothetical protein
MSKDVMVTEPEKVTRLERDMLRMPQAACTVRHHFSPGLYIRELRMPAGTIALGHYQRHAHMNILMQGACRVLNPEGHPIEMRAPLTFVGAPGRKVGLVMEDIVWLNVYPNPDDCQDIDALEARHLLKSPTYRTHQNEQDYVEMLTEAGVSAELVWEQSSRDDDCIPWPAGTYKVKVGDSKIAGKGLNCTADFEAGEVVAPAIWQGKRTPAGRYTNHSSNPNVEPLQRLDGNTYWVALRPISGCRGGQDGEEITIDYRQTVALALRRMDP